MKKSNTIQAVSHEICTGCGACYNKCPVNAISMKKEKSGFAFPEINEDICVNCGLCLAACPLDKVIKKEENEIRMYSAVAPKEIHLASSSGGVFSLFANYVLKKKGVVCGAAFSEDYKSVEHIIISEDRDLQKLRGSKYVQSDMGLVMRELKTCLDDGQYVLFTGCPCQVAGMRAFLGKEYKRLILVDILCHGAPSPDVYRKYLEEIAKGRTIVKVDFREKAHFGWGTAFSIFFEDGSVYRENCFEDKYLRGFSGGLITRSSCSHCPFATAYTHMSDITLGDYWGIKEVDADSFDQNGVSLVLVNNEKGAKLFKELGRRSGYTIKEQSVEKTLEVAKHSNGQLLAPKRKHDKYSHFFQTFPVKGFNGAFDDAVNSQFDVGVVGWWNNENYGGALTYYSLYRTLEAMGFSVLMIRHVRWEAEREFSSKRIDHRFAQKYYNISKNYDKGTMYPLNDHVKAFISGSDQLFNPWLWLYSGPEYFLSFVENNRKLISYASSFGNNYDVNNPHHMEIAYNLHRFDALSVREDYGVDICRDAFGLDAVHVMDPVFLCDPEEFKKIAKSTGMKKDHPYFLNYILDPNDEKREVIRKMKERLGMDYVNLVDASGWEKRAEVMGLPNTMGGIDVEEWVNYYINADFVITDSFHGTCFAIIFRKPFISIANPGRGVKRPESMLRTTGLLDRLVYDTKTIWDNEKLFEPIDYERVFSEYINPKVEASREWLRKAITEPKNAGLDLFKLIDSEIRRTRR